MLLQIFLQLRKVVYNGIIICEYEFEKQNLTACTRVEGLPLQLYSCGVVAESNRIVVAIICDLLKGVFNWLMTLRIVAKRETETEKS